MPRRNHNKNYSRLAPKKSSIKSRRAFVLQFDTLPKKAAASTVNKKYKELKELTRDKSALKFVKSRSPEQLKKLKSAGAIVTKKGAFVRKRDGMKATIKDGIITERGGPRAEYLIPLNKIEVAALMGDPVAVVENLLNGEYAWIRAAHPGEKYYIRLAFPYNASATDYTPDRLTYYLTQGIHDTPDTRTGKVKKSAAAKRKQIAKDMIGVRVIFFKSEGSDNGKKKRKKGKRSN